MTRARAHTRPGFASAIAIAQPYVYVDDPTCPQRERTGEPCGCHWCNRAQHGEFYWLKVTPTPGGRR